MAKEIERKFLVINDGYKNMAVGSEDIRQGYISRNPDSTVRVRTRGDRGYLTIKSRTESISRDEWEYQIPVSDALEMLDRLCGPVLSKTRYIVPGDAGMWEVDEFHGRLEGLVVAEIELGSAEVEISALPAFVGLEVSDDPRYFNSNLAAQA